MYDANPIVVRATQRQSCRRERRFPSAHNIKIYLIFLPFVVAILKVSRGVFVFFFFSLKRFAVDFKMVNLSL